MSSSFLSAQTVATINALKERGALTTQALQDPPTIQLRRRSTSSEAFTNVLTPFRPVAVELADRLEQSTGQNAGLAETVSGGSFTVLGTIAARRDDRFQLPPYDSNGKGQVCVVTLVEPPGPVTQTVQFAYLGGI